MNGAIGNIINMGGKIKVKMKNKMTTKDRIEIVSLYIKAIFHKDVREYLRYQSAFAKQAEDV